MLKKYERKVEDNLECRRDIFCYFLIIFFRCTTSFAESLLGLSCAQSCPEFGFFNGNLKTSGILRADVGQLEAGLGGCGMYASWGGRRSHAMRNNRFKGRWIQLTLLGLEASPRVCS